VFFYLRKICFIKYAGNISKIITKPSKKQSPANNNCVTAINNATQYATLTIKNWAIEAIIKFLHSINPFVVTQTFLAITLSFQYGSAFAQVCAASRDLKSMVRYGE